MSRLASAAKAHYYPLPVNLIPQIASHIAAPHGGRLLDPCAGEGIALTLLAQHLALEPFGIELGEKRAAAAQEAANILLTQRRQHKTKLPHQDRQQTRVFHSDYCFVRTGSNSFTCLYLNPPFDHSGDEDGRLEYQFLRDTRPHLAPSGLLIYVVPQKLLRHPKTADYLAAWFSDLRVFRFPDECYSAFKQIVLLGTRNRKAAVPDPQIVQDLQQKSRLGSDLPALTAASIPSYTLPPVIIPTQQLTFIPSQVDIKLVHQEAQSHGIVAGEAWRANLFPTQQQHPFRPLTPLRQGHLVNIISAGYLNNHLLSTCTERQPEVAGRSDSEQTLFIKGRTYKTIHTHTEQEQDSRGGLKVTTYDTEKYVTDITTITPSGEIESVSGAKLEPFLKQWIGQLTQAVTDSYRPLYQFDLNGYDAVLNRLNQNRIIPNTTLRGLAPAQKHAVAAAATRLDRRYQNQRDALVIGEMGCGVR